MARIAQAQLENREVKVEKKKLLATLRYNLIQHEANYQKAKEVYKDVLLKRLDKAKSEVQSKLEKNFEKVERMMEDIDFKDSSTTPQTWRLLEEISIHMPRPQSYASAYRKAIDMFEWEVEETITLTYAQFVCFVSDEWEWKSDFFSNTMSYTQEGGF